MDNKEDARIDSEIHKVAASSDPFAAAVRATRMPMLITDPSQYDNPIVFANDAFSRLTGYSREEIIGRNCRFLQGTGTNDEDVTRIRDAVARREPIEIDLLNYRKNGSSFWNRVLISPVFDDTGELKYFFASQFDVSPDRHRLAELQKSQESLEIDIEKRMIDLSHSESRLRFILSAAQMGTWTLDVKSGRLVASEQCKINFGREASETLTYEEFQNAIFPEDIDHWRSVVARAIETNEDFQLEYRISTPKGERRWIEVRGQINSDSLDTAITMVGITQDITARKEAEEHRKVLTRELLHRVKNSLATVQSIFTQSLRSASSLDEAATAVSGRIGAMAVAHDILARDDWSRAPLKDIIEEALKPFLGFDIRIAGPRIVFEEKAVSALTLGLYELATNSVKYGALSKENGSVTINWEILNLEEPTLKFHWSEMGGPEVKEPTRRGFGSKIIERLIPTELNGTGKLSYEREGLLYELLVPINSEQLA
ncbi:PAS domain-containing protein [Phyllobacterium ifriqiyense]|uniref:PAS domain-containing protein n=1 Tax=Phyllobacterium ifriqiyense TaxID=314238 RepID=UPI0033952673